MPAKSRQHTHSDKSPQSTDKSMATVSKPTSEVVYSQMQDVPTNLAAKLAARSVIDPLGTGSMPSSLDGGNVST